uniref:Uncharacterized protein n=1 Tax=Siphoviridae sp. ctomJ2 TaxID=2827593 RepID=A0A8S5LK88_9CAUD|nr:MAG TPA: hypothetical protein [Siphoviridae sp. ctomJ2]
MCFCNLYNSYIITLFNCRVQSVKIQQVSFGN